ncbi:membrane protein YdbS with pleckstrin-like domain [Myroides gitamensis]|uniref:PH domain-containing protein n=1 Tax=Myroides odoratus TaxID=256 RepID=UPI002166E94C|nr:PH domain-containing protein [Myroides odoratus]MCS4238197.1 membrane protein YdbS with pleckstrin-like domain [Myroides odoratus]MDH6601003.1 membrane protein YdbS with pleckstrin-like domain [Myroides gitamensis]
MKTKYSSKVSLGTITLFLTIGIACLLAAFFIQIWYIWLIALTVLAMLIDVYFQTYYEIDTTQNLLRIRGGIFVNKKIPIESIRKIEESKSAVSGPALSNQRLEIYYKTYDSILISPENPIDFITQIQTYNSDIEFITKKK